MIIHFTKKQKDLIAIVNSGELLLHYCKENFFNTPEKSSSSAAHPMVSFSNYGVTNLCNKKITYGHYGISFKDYWVKGNKINPVVYMNNNSFVSSALEALLVARRTSKLSKDVRLAIMKIKCFTKNSNGYNSYTGQKNFNFKKENEWRYVPEKHEINNELISIPTSTYKENEEKYNNLLRDYSLKFNTSDIKCIYVPKDELEHFKEKFSTLISIIKASPWEYIDSSKSTRLKNRKTLARKKM